MNLDAPTIILSITMRCSSSSFKESALSKLLGQDLKVESFGSLFELKRSSAANPRVNVSFSSCRKIEQGDEGGWTALTQPSKLVFLQPPTADERPLLPGGRSGNEARNDAATRFFSPEHSSPVDVALQPEEASTKGQSSNYAACDRTPNVTHGHDDMLDDEPGRETDRGLRRGFLGSSNGQDQEARDFDDDAGYCSDHVGGFGGATVEAETEATVEHHSCELRSAINHDAVLQQQEPQEPKVPSEHGCLVDACNCKVVESFCTHA